jgi:hypothetical protein
MRGAWCSLFCAFYILSFLQTSEGVSQLFLNIYNFVNDAMCGADNPPQKTSLRYDSRSGPLEAASVEGKTIHYAYPYPPVSDFYRYEGTRRNGTICSFCPYHQYPEVFSPEFFLLGNIRVIPTPMYGPCFNGLPSKKISCVQNQALYPPEFAGEYYYPDQKGDLLVNNGEPFQSTNSLLTKAML